MAKTPAKKLSEEQVAQDWIAAAHLSLMSFAELLNENYEVNWHHEVVADRLEAVERGEIKRLIISEPNRYGKSEECSVLFPAWYLGHHPDKEIMLGSHSFELAGDFGKDTRDIVESELYREIFPHVKVKQDSRKYNDWQTEKGGGYYSVGRKGSAEGHGYDLLIVDDLIKNPTEAESEAYIKEIWNFWIATLKRRANGPDAAIVVPMTRWGARDIIGLILDTAEKSGEHWEVLSFSAIAEADEEWTTSYGKTFYRTKGEPLWSARHTLEDLEQVMIEAGRWWAPRFQQDVAGEFGTIFKREDLEKYEYEGSPGEGLKFISIDSAEEEHEKADYSAFGEYVDVEGTLYKTGQWWDRLEFPALEDFAIELFKQRRPDFFLIEPKSSGTALIRVLDGKVIDGRKIRVISTRQAFKDAGIDANISKMERGNIAQAFTRTGAVRFPKYAPWKETLYKNLCGFPNVKHDDIYDETCQAIIYAKKKKDPKTAGSLLRRRA